jgi:eukaryotic-like serine/threonine-protein kinase
LGRFDEARRTFAEALSRKLDDAHLHTGLYDLSFLAGDAQGMASQAAWLEARPGKHEIISDEADTEAYRGKLTRARQLTRRAGEEGVRSDNREAAALWRVDGALREAAFGNLAEARQESEAALKLAPDNRDIQVQAALAFAWSRNTIEVQKLESDLKKSYPLDTRVNDYWLPTIDARTELGTGNPPEAVRRLQVVSYPLELGIPFEAVNIACLYPVYTRGEAYLAAGQGSEAAGEFQKILDHPGIVQNCATGALAHLGLARAYAVEAGLPRQEPGSSHHVRNRGNGGLKPPLQPDALAKARIAYQDFLALWKDADPDIPILKQAKAEYAKLQ